MARVLILEPAEDVRELVARLLTRLGHDPLLAHELAAEDAADVVVVEPADEQSLRAARTLRAERPDLPIVCATVLPRAAVGDVCSHGYLEKPFHLADLERLINDVLVR